MLCSSIPFLISIIFTSCEEIFKVASSSSSPAIPQKKKELWPPPKTPTFLFYLSENAIANLSLSYFPFQVHIFFNWQPCRQMIFCNVRVLRLIRKKIHMFWQAYINFKIFYLIEYILPPRTQFLKKKLLKFGPNLPFFKSDLSHQVLEFQNSVKYMLGIYTTSII